MADEIKLLSAGAVKPGLVKVIEAFSRQTGDNVAVTFATAPAIAQRIKAGETVDLLIAPSAVLDDLLKGKNLPDAKRTILGRIGVGVMVRQGAPLPQIATVEEFKASLLSAGSIVYNQASTGTYLDNLLDRLGIAAQLASRKTCYADFAGVLAHVSQGRGDEIGFGATTVIVESASAGVIFVGPLPREIQNYTSYGAALLDSHEGSRALMDFIAAAAAQTLLSAAGIDCT